MHQGARHVWLAAAALLQDAWDIWLAATTLLQDAGVERTVESAGSHFGCWSVLFSVKPVMTVSTCVL